MSGGDCRRGGDVVGIDDDDDDNDDVDAEC